MYRQALRYSGGMEATAEEVLQEAWVRAVRGLPRFEHRSTLGTWLHAIVVRCAFERVRADRRHGEELPDAEAVRASRPGGAEARIDLERVFEALPPGYRSVLVLHDVEGYTHEEIGDLLGIRPGTSKSQLSRARAWMRDALGGDYLVESHA